MENNLQPKKEWKLSKATYLYYYVPDHLKNLWWGGVMRLRFKVGKEVLDIKINDLLRYQARYYKFKKGESYTIGHNDKDGCFYSSNGTKAFYRRGGRIFKKQLSSGNTTLVNAAEFNKPKAVASKKVSSTGSKKIKHKSTEQIF